MWASSWFYFSGEPWYGAVRDSSCHSQDILVPSREGSDANYIKSTRDDTLLHTHFHNMNNGGMWKYFFGRGPGVWLKEEGEPNHLKGNLEIPQILQKIQKVFLWQTSSFIPKLSRSWRTRVNTGKSEHSVIWTTAWASIGRAWHWLHLSCVFPGPGQREFIGLDKAEVLGEKGWGSWYSAPSKSAQRVQRKSNNVVASSFHYCEPFNPWSPTKK